MKITLLSIGDEVLSGNVINTNAAWLADLLWLDGFEVVSHLTIGDDETAIQNALLAAQGGVDALISTGGLGPTADDFTLEIAAKTFGKKLNEHAPTLARLEEFFLSRGRNMTDNQRKQALIPEGATVIENNLGTAPGVLFSEGKTKYFFLPGVPKEMKAMMHSTVIPELQKSRLAPRVFSSKVLRCFGAEEARLDHLIRPLLQSRVYHEKAKIAFRVSFPEILIKVSAWEETKEKSERELQKALEPILEKIAPYQYGQGEETLEQKVGALLLEKKLSVGVAESCTGGLIGHRLTQVPGASRYFLGSVVAYSNSAKENLLGVAHKTIESFGAVSRNTALEMANGVRIALGADIGLATTGIAGPGGGSEEKPVGTFHVAIAASGRLWETNFFFPYDREGFKQLAAGVALNALRKHLLGTLKG